MVVLKMSVRAWQHGFNLKLALPLLTLFFIASICPALAAPITLNGVFSDHMVLQSGQPIAVYGTATPGEPVGVKLGDKKAVAMTNEKGEFVAMLEALPPGGPHELHVFGGQDKISINDVMVGEVWLCSGQANMLMSLKQAGLEAKADTLGGGENSIRLFKVDFALGRTPQRKLDSKWTILDKVNAAECAAIPYFFASELKSKMNVPIGIIVSAAAQTPAHSWISMAALNKMPEGRSKLAAFEEQFDTYLAYREQKILNNNGDADQPAVWDREADATYQHGQNAVPAPPAASLYNGMIAPLVPYTVRGVLWYQGEINVARPDTYEKYFTALMHDWRRKWKKPHLPFLFVQLPPAGERLEMPSSVSKVARLRDAQAKASLLPWTYMVSAIDSVDAKQANWHASNKELIGKRLAQMALATQYNKPGPFRGPSLDTVAVEGNKVRIRFKNATHGLTKKGDALKGFAIAGDDKKLVWAISEIDGDSVVVWHKLINKPSLVTYSWADNPDGNLYNGDNLPAIPFRAQVVHSNIH